MRAAVYHGTLDVRIEHVPEPDDPVGEEVVLRVIRAGICGTDASEYLHGPRLIPLAARHPGSQRAGPVILGHEFCGRVEAVGRGVEMLAVGDRVVSGAGVSCGSCPWCRSGRTNLCERYYTLGLQADGGLAEYVKASARICCTVSDECPDDAAVLAQPLAVALHAVDRGGPGTDGSVAIIGVGGIGVLILAGVAELGVARLIAVDVDAARLEQARRIGASHLVDARANDAAGAIRELTDGHGADVVFEASGALEAPQLALEATKRGGRVVLVGLDSRPRPFDLHDLTLREVDVVSSLAHVCDVDLPAAVRMLELNPLVGSIVDRVVDLEALPDALAALGGGRLPGKIIVDPSR